MSSKFADYHNAISAYGAEGDWEDDYLYDEEVNSPLPLSFLEGESFLDNPDLKAEPSYTVDTSAPVTPTLPGDINTLRSGVANARRVAKLVAKVGSLLDYTENNEHAAGGVRPYTERSSQANKDRRSGISIGWEQNDAVDPGSDEPEPPLVNQESGSIP